MDLIQRRAATDRGTESGNHRCGHARGGRSARKTDSSGGSGKTRPENLDDLAMKMNAPSAGSATDAGAGNLHELDAIELLTGATAAGCGRRRQRRGRQHLVDCQWNGRSGKGREALMQSVINEPAFNF